MTELLTTPEAAAYARRHPATVREAARLGEVRSMQRVAHGPRLYRREWLDAWLNGEHPKRSAGTSGRARAAWPPQTRRSR